MLVDYCPCDAEQPDPCPACGARVDGNDPVRGRCQARYSYRRPPILFFELRRRTCETVASVPVL
jgi:hypothetical protein